METINNILFAPRTNGVVFTLTAPGSTPRMGRITYSQERDGWDAVQDYIDAVGTVPTLYATRRKDGDIEW